MSTPNPFAQELEKRKTQGNPFIAERKRRTEAQAASRTPPAAAVFGVQALRSFTDNILGLPSTIGDFIAAGISPSLGEQITAKAEGREPSQHPLATAFQSVPSPTTGDIAAGIRAVPQALAGQEGAFAQERQRQTQADVAFRESSPKAALAGETAGDIATLLTGRAPIRQALRRFTTPTFRTPTAAVGTVKRGFQEFTNRPAFQTLERGFRRAAETGVEGSFLAAINDSDPASAALASAGAQSVGSLSLWLAGRPIKALAPTVIGTTIAIQMLKQATPGIEQNIFESLDKSIGKALFVLGTGMFAGMSGLGRLPRSVTDNFGLVSDSLTPAMRVPLLNLLGDLTREKEQGSDRTLRVLEEFSQDPDSFGAVARNQINRAFKEGKSMSETVERLMKDRTFRKRFEEIND